MAMNWKFGLMFCEITAVFYTLYLKIIIYLYKENAWCKINEIAKKRIFDDKDKTAKYQENEYVIYLDELKWILFKAVKNYQILQHKTLIISQTINKI